MILVKPSCPNLLTIADPTIPLCPATYTLLFFSIIRIVLAYESPILSGAHPSGSARCRHEPSPWPNRAGCIWVPIPASRVPWWHLPAAGQLPWDGNNVYPPRPPRHPLTGEYRDRPTLLRWPFLFPT